MMLVHKTTSVVCPNHSERASIADEHSPKAYATLMFLNEKVNSSSTSTWQTGERFDHTIIYMHANRSIFLALLSAVLALVLVA